MIELKRNDEKFNLDNVTDEELFVGLKGGIAKSLRNFKGFEDIPEDNLRLNKELSFRTTQYGKDGNLYPKITLGTTAKIPTERFPVTFQLLIMPFDIKMLINTSSLVTVEPEELSNAFNEYILNRFPENDYAEKKQKYNEMAAIRERVYNRMVFGE